MTSIFNENCSRKVLEMLQALTFYQKVTLANIFDWCRNFFSIFHFLVTENFCLVYKCHIAWNGKPRITFFYHGVPLVKLQVQLICTGTLVPSNTCKLQADVYKKADANVVHMFYWKCPILF